MFLNYNSCAHARPTFNYNTYVCIKYTAMMIFIIQVYMYKLTVYFWVNVYQDKVCVLH